MAASRARDVGPAGPVGPRSIQRGRARLNADSTSEPEGLTRRVMLNVMEAFFRRPWLHLLPLILMIVLGVVTAFGTGKEFRSVGTISASNTSSIEQITQPNAGGGTFETAATLVARNINEQLRTDRFLNLVVAEAGFEPPTPEEAGLLRTEISTSVGATADGDSLVRVAATTDNPEDSFRLASGTLTAYLDTVLANEVQQSEQNEVFLTTQVDEALLAKTEAEANLDQFLIDNPVRGEDTRPPEQQVLVDRRQAEVDRADARYDAALTALDAAEQNTAEATIRVGQRLQILDEPEENGAAEPRIRKAALTVILFAVLGLGLTLASVVVTATLDRTIRLPNDITGKFGLDVLAVVPDARSR